MSSEHVLTNPFFTELQRRLIRNFCIMSPLAGTGGWLMGGAKTDSFTLAVFAVVVLGFMPFIGWINIRRQLASFRTLRIVADETGLRRTQDGFPVLAISWPEITAIEEIGDRGIVVSGGIPRRQLFLLRTLEGFDELRSRLAAIHAITTKPAPKNTWLPTVSSIGAVVAMVVFYRSESSPVVVTLGLLLIAMLVWSFVAVQRSVQVDRRLKLAVWTVWLVVPSLVFRLYQVMPGN